LPNKEDFLENLDFKVEVNEDCSGFGKLVSIVGLEEEELRLGVEL
jgi:hypothetical protein